MMIIIDHTMFTPGLVWAIEREEQWKATGKWSGGKGKRELPQSL